LFQSVQNVKSPEDDPALFRIETCCEIKVEKSKVLNLLGDILQHLQPLENNPYFQCYFGQNFATILAEMTQLGLAYKLRIFD